MSNLDTINVGGIDFDIEDSVSRANSTSALNITAYKEDDNTASQAYSIIGTPINWKGDLYYTSATIAAGDTLAIGTNLISATNIGQMLSNIKVYVNDDGELVFRDSTGADSVLPFSSTKQRVLIGSYSGNRNIDISSYNDTDINNYLLIVTRCYCDWRSVANYPIHNQSGSLNCYPSMTISGTNLVISGTSAYWGSDPFRANLAAYYNVYHLE